MDGVPFASTSRCNAEMDDDNSLSKDSILFLLLEMATDVVSLEADVDVDVDDIPSFVANEAYVASALDNCVDNDRACVRACV